MFKYNTLLLPPISISLIVIDFKNVPIIIELLKGDSESELQIIEIYVSV